MSECKHQILSCECGMAGCQSDASRPDACPHAILVGKGTIELDESTETAQFYERYVCKQCGNANLFREV